METDFPYRTLPVKLRRRICYLLFMAVAVCGTMVWLFYGTAGARAERHLRQAREFRAGRDLVRAEQSAAAALELDSTLGEAALLAARCADAQGEPARAAAYLERTAAVDRSTQQQAAAFLAALNHHKLRRLAAAERSYRAVLELAPDDVEANAGLAMLLGLCARKSEAIPCILRVVRQGTPTDLLMLPAREDGVIGDRAALEQARNAAPDDPNPLVGMAWHAGDAGDVDRAIDLLREALRLDPSFAPAHAALGRQLLAARRNDELVAWARQLPPGVAALSDVWLVRGRMAEDDGDSTGAIRCYGEAARLAPESKAVIFRLVRLFSAAGRTDVADRFSGQVLRIQELETVQSRVLFSGTPPTPADFLELIDAYQKSGRRWEALGWCRLAGQMNPDHADLQRREIALRRAVEGLSLRLTVETSNPALAVDFSEFPLPQHRHRQSSPVTIGDARNSPVSFRDDAAATGLQFRYFNGTSGAPARRMFEFTGGGIGVMDFDGDGFPDVWFTQGRRWPPASPDAEHVDRLFRNASARRFDDVTAAAGLRESGFGQGVAAGDFNSDGFPDLYVANIGPNCLWCNNGDGTFTDVTQQAGFSGAAWTTSCVLADLDGDGFSDIYDVNYVTSDDVFDRVCVHPDGSPKICMPFDFEPQPDRFWKNDGAGRFTDATSEFLPLAPPGKGLGAAVWNADGSGRLSLFVANDTTPGFFFVPEGQGSSSLRMRERGFESGLALNGDGKATGAMGIALGDVDGNGGLDVHVTNFSSESNTLYMNVGNGVYEDRSRDLGLHAATVDLLGFGTQFLDADLDGRLELFVANGHVDDWRSQGRPYRMPAQLFRWSGRRFDVETSPEAGPYFDESWLGRAVARLDWNRDGRDDLLVGHLGDPAALLTNTTPSTGNSLRVRLVAVNSQRDAIGTTLVLRAGARRWTHQLTAGDGYQASNERQLILGLGKCEQVNELLVQWPSGSRQTFANLPAQGELLLIEGRSLTLRPSGMPSN